MRYDLTMYDPKVGKGCFPSKAFVSGISAQSWDIHQRLPYCFGFPSSRLLQLTFLNAAQLKLPLISSEVANYNVIVHRNECLLKDQ